MKKGLQAAERAPTVNTSAEPHAQAGKTLPLGSCTSSGSRMHSWRALRSLSAVRTHKGCFANVLQNWMLAEMLQTKYVQVFKLLGDMKGNRNLSQVPGPPNQLPSLPQPQRDLVASSEHNPIDLMFLAKEPGPWTALVDKSIPARAHPPKTSSKLITGEYWISCKQRSCGTPSDRQALLRQHLRN